MGSCQTITRDPSMLRADRSDVDKLLARVSETGEGLRGEFLMSPVDFKHSPALVALAAWHGFLPMGAGHDSDLVLLKLHRQRCILKPSNVHVGKRQRKLSSKFRLTIDEAFTTVVRGIQ